MVNKDLQTFGKTLRYLRKTAGFSQEELAEKLSLIHAKADPATDLRLDGNRISKWERAYISKDGREWRPKRQHLLYLIELFANRLPLQTAQQWALQAGYRLDTKELEEILRPRLNSSISSSPPVSNLQTGLKQLDLLPRQQLFGIETQYWSNE